MHTPRGGLCTGRARGEDSSAQVCWGQVCRGQVCRGTRDRGGANAEALWTLLIRGLECKRYVLRDDPGVPLFLGTESSVRKKGQSR